MTQTLLLLLLFVHGSQEACNVCPNIQNVPSGYHVVRSSEFDGLISNPGRGFYIQMETHANSFQHLTIEVLDNYRHQEGVTLALRMYVLDGLAASRLPDSLLTNIRSDLQLLRQAGWTAILRFSYTTTARSSAPYGDATKAIILEHIQQLGPIWNEYAGLISVIQAGFIGTWGEWYYTTYFGDPSHRDPNGPYGVSLQHWQDRRDVVSKILFVAPWSIPVQVRTPFYKTQLWQSNAPTTLQDVTSGSYRGRTGHHNDCFLKDNTDMGTYSDVTAEKHYLAMDSLYLPVGGETCGRATGSSGERRSDCPTATAEMKRFHWSFVHAAYHPDVLRDWKDQGCYKDFQLHLGYRLSVKQVILPQTVPTAGDLCYYVTLSNEGFAAPYKHWNVLLALKQRSGGNFYSVKLPNVDSRSWLAGQDHVIAGSVRVALPLGVYDVYLGLVEESMERYADYYILLANANNADPQSGLNPLHASIQVDGHSPSSTTCPALLIWSAPQRSRYSRIEGRPNTGNTTTGSPACTPLSVPNPSFEHTSPTWDSFMSGFDTLTSSAQEGAHCIRVVNGGASHQFHFPTPVYKMILTAYSRHDGASHPATSDYSIYCDIMTPSQTPVYGLVETFTAGHRLWHKAQLNMNVPQGISTATCYLMYRNLQSLGGAAYFDNVKAWTLPSSASFSDCNTSG